MSSIGSTSVPSARAPTDPAKHVNYVLGMVLGAEDFTQEFSYHSERARWMVRELLGFGTAWGLGIIKRSGDHGPEVTVSPGVAVSPRGQLLRVTSAQSASLDDWLAANAAGVELRLGTPPSSTLDVHVVLHYRESLTDLVPLPGEPCRTEDEVTAPSRIQDDYKLELRLDPPAQTEEDALRDFLQWLRIHVQPVSGGGTSLADFLQAIRTAVVESVPSGSPLDYLDDASPPAPIPIPAASMEHYLRAAFRLWVTELRPRWRHPLLSTPPGESTLLSPEALHASDAVLLATLRLPLIRAPGGGPWKVASLEGILIHEESRPYLVPLRMVQEWNLVTSFLSSAGGSVPTPAPVAPRITSITPLPAPLDSEIRIVGEHFAPFASDNTVTINGTPVTPSSESTSSSLLVVIPASLEGGPPPPGTTRLVPVTVTTSAGTVSTHLHVSQPLDISLPRISHITPPEAVRGRSIQIQTNILQAHLAHPFRYQHVWISFHDPVALALEQLLWKPTLSPHIFDASGVLTVNLPAELPGLSADHTPLRTRIRLITQSYISGIIRVSPAFDYTVHHGL